MPSQLTRSSPTASRQGTQEAAHSPWAERLIQRVNAIAGNVQANNDVHEEEQRQANMHQLDPFVANLLGYKLKDDTATMEAPLFSLSTKPDMDTWRWISPDKKKWLEVTPSSIGRATLAREVVARIVAGNGAKLDGGADVRIEPFDPATIEAAMNKGRKDWRKAIDAATGTANREAFVYGTPAGGMLAFVIQSAVADNVLAQVFATLDDSAARQFTGNRGALFWVELQGIDANQLRSVHVQDSDPGEQPTALKLGVNDFLNRAPDHIVGVVFGSRSCLVPTVDGSADSGGVTNFFLKKESPLWHASFRDPLRAAGMAE